MLVIGELINSTRKQVRAAIENKDSAYIQNLAQRQVEAGARWVDVNAGAFSDDEVVKLRFPRSRCASTLPGRPRWRRALRWRAQIPS